MVSVWARQIVLTAALLHVSVLAAALPELDLKSDDRILVLAPHPDDEVLGCGGVIQKAVANHLPIRIVFLTYGDHNEWAFMVYRRHPVITPGAVRRLGLIRHEEAVAAAKVLGLSKDELTFLGYPDLGTLPIWSDHWAKQPSFHSRLINASAVPYSNSFRPGAPFRGEEILHDLETIFREFRPTKVFVSHPADHHPDHRALYLFATVALWNVEETVRAHLFPYLIHYKDWPEPKGAHLDLPLEPPARLHQYIRWDQVSLAPEIVKRNQTALKAHRTQYEYSANRLLALIRANGLYGDFPMMKLQAARENARPPDTSLSFPVQEPPDREGERPRKRSTVLAVEGCTATLNKDSLVLSIGHSRPLAEELELSVFLFGYRSGQPFLAMPKLRITINALEHEVYVQLQRLPREKVAIQRSLRRITLRVSAKELGNPERLLMTTTTYIADLPVDWTAWRVLQLVPAARN